MAQYAHLSIPDPEWAKVSETFPFPQIASVEEFARTETELRKKYHAANRPPQNDDLVVNDELLPVEAGKNPLRTYVPKRKEGDPSDGFPILVWMYGGGFAVGSLDDDDKFLRDLALTFRIVCVSADYRKTPHYHYPTPINDSYACLKWAVDNASNLNANIQRGLILGGLSSGASIATVLAQRAAVDESLKGLVTGQLLLIPNTIAPGAYPEEYKPELLSLDKDEDKRILPKYLFQMFQEAYHAEYPPENPEISPALWGSLNYLPKAYMQVCGLDVLRDEGLLYEKLMREAGVPTKLDIYPGCPHGFWLFCKDFEAAKKQRRDLHEGLKWLLQ